jgi:hypothetical protein
MFPVFSPSVSSQVNNATPLMIATLWKVNRHDHAALLLKAFRPTTRPVIDPYNLNDISMQSIGDDERGLGNNELTRTWDATGTPHLRIVRK